MRYVNFDVRAWLAETGDWLASHFSDDRHEGLLEAYVAAIRDALAEDEDRHDSFRIAFYPKGSPEAEWFEGRDDPSPSDPTRERLLIHLQMIAGEVVDRWTDRHLDADEMEMEL